MTRVSKIRTWFILAICFYLIVIASNYYNFWIYVKHYRLYSAVNEGMSRAEVRNILNRLGNFQQMSKRTLRREVAEEGDVYFLSLGLGSGDVINIYYKNDVVIKKEAFSEFTTPIFTESSISLWHFNDLEFYLFMTLVLIVGLLGIQAEKVRYSATQLDNTLLVNIAVFIKILGILAIIFLAIIVILYLMRFLLSGVFNLMDILSA